MSNSDVYAYMTASVIHRAMRVERFSLDPIACGPLNITKKNNYCSTYVLSYGLFKIEWRETTMDEVYAETKKLTIIEQYNLLIMLMPIIECDTCDESGSVRGNFSDIFRIAIDALRFAITNMSSDNYNIEKLPSDNK